MHVPTSRWTLDVSHAQYSLGATHPCHRCGAEQPSLQPPEGEDASPTEEEPSRGAKRFFEEQIRGTPHGARPVHLIGRGTPRVRETGVLVDGHGYIVL